jgi:RimJ/RimL family protein N-acetyltransferase/spore coat polysaccharide biosynthesis protein SpsF (cytidylyltransferase family)
MADARSVPDLRGERIDLVALSRWALDDLHAYSVMPDFYRHIELKPFTSRAETEAYLEKLLGRSDGRTGHYWMIVLKSTGRVIGTFGLLDIDWRKGMAEIGYGLSPQSWGAGLFSEALQLVVSWAFTAGGLHRLWAKTQIDNAPSITALERNGFRREGILRDFYLSHVDGGRRAAVVLARLGGEAPADGQHRAAVQKMPGFITVRTSSSRLPQKCLMPFGDGNVLEHVIRRARHAAIEPIVCTSVDPTDDVIERIARAEGVRCFRGSLANKLKRWSDCAAHFGLVAFHTVDADDPFFDGEEMHRSFAFREDGGWDMVAPTESSAAGGASSGYTLTADIVKRASARLPDEADTEMMWYHVAKVPGLKKAILPGSGPDPVRVRLTLDYPEDYWLLESIRRMIGGLAPRREVNELFRRNPDLYRVNWFRNEEWAAGQAAKKV